MIHETPAPELFLAENEASTPVADLCRRGYRVLALFDAPEGPGAERTGRRHYDYRDAALIGRSAVSGLGEPPFRCEWIAAFSPEYFDAANDMRGGECGWFSYRLDEALHLSMAEKRILTECFDDLRREAGRKSDCYCRCILSRHIRRMLDYVSRFYERQFTTRELENRRLLADYRTFLNEYLFSGRVPLSGAPDPALCAERLGLSESYFADLLKHETGQTHENHFRTARLDMAQWLLTNTPRPVGRIAAELGFSSGCAFSHLFRKLYGVSPEEYRRL